MRVYQPGNRIYNSSLKGNIYKLNHQRQLFSMKCLKPFLIALVLIHYVPRFSGKFRVNCLSNEMQNQNYQQLGRSCFSALKDF